jgi:hypothetical protein
MTPSHPRVRPEPPSRARVHPRATTGPLTPLGTAPRGAAALFLLGRRRDSRCPRGPVDTRPCATTREERSMARGGGARQRAMLRVYDQAVPRPVGPPPEGLKQCQQGHASPAMQDGRRGKACPDCATARQRRQRRRDT